MPRILLALASRGIGIIPLSKKVLETNFCIITKAGSLTS
jgi:hypothetical protein